MFVENIPKPLNSTRSPRLRACLISFRVIDTTRERSFFRKFGYDFFSWSRSFDFTMANFYSSSFFFFSKSSDNEEKGKFLPLASEP